MRSPGGAGAELHAGFLDEEEEEEKKTTKPEAESERSSPPAILPCVLPRRAMRRRRRRGPPGAAPPPPGLRGVLEMPLGCGGAKATSWSVALQRGLGLCRRSVLEGDPLKGGGGGAATGGRSAASCPFVCLFVCLSKPILLGCCCSGVAREARAQVSM